MPYTTVVAGTVITASWGNANVRDQVVTPFATAATRTAQVTSPVEGMLSWLSDTDRLDVYNGSGHVLLAAPVNYVDKDSDETVSATGLQDDNDLVLPVLPANTYLMDGMLFVASGFAGYDIAVGFTLPASATLDFGASGPYFGDFTGTDTFGKAEFIARLAQTTPTTAVTYATANPSTLAIPFRGRIVTAGTAGNVQLRWAPNSAGSVTVKQGSWMRLECVTPPGR